MSVIRQSISKKSGLKLRHYSSQKLKKEILEIVEKYLDLQKYRVFFFGSRVTGCPDDRGDIDIGIEGHTRLKPGVLLDIQEEVDNLPMLYLIEMVDFKMVDSDFRKIALRKIELIN